MLLPESATSNKKRKVSGEISSDVGCDTSILPFRQRRGSVRFCQARDLINSLDSFA